MFFCLVIFIIAMFHEDVICLDSTYPDSTCLLCDQKFNSLFNMTLRDAFTNFSRDNRARGDRAKVGDSSELRPGICESTILYDNDKFYVHKLSKSLRRGGNTLYLRHEGFFISLVMLLRDIEKILKVKPPAFLFNFETKDNPTCNYPRQEIQSGTIQPVRALIHHSFCSPRYCNGILLLPISYNQRISAMEDTQMLDEECSKYRWEKRKEKLFWRGSNAGKKEEYRIFGWNSKDLPRLKAVKMAKHRKDLDIEFGYVSWKEFTTNKYIIALAGNTYSSLFKHALRSGSCILRQEERMFEWYEPFVKAWVHYVPLSWDLSDLNSKLAWVRANDAEAKIIAERAREVGVKLFTPEVMSCYSYCILNHFRSSLLLDLNDYSFRASFIEVHSVCNSKAKKRKECINLQKI